MSAATFAFICPEFCQTDPERVGVNPNVAHEHMAGLSFLHAVGSADTSTNA
jgi:hypothetical protein